MNISVANGSTNSLMVNFTQFIDKFVALNDATQLRKFLESDQNHTALDTHLAESVQSVCNHIGLLSDSNESPDVLNVLVEFLQRLPSRFDTGECLLLLVGQLTVMQKTFACGYLLRSLATCIVNTGFDKFPRIQNALDKLSRVVAKLCEENLTQPDAQRLTWFLGECVDFYEFILADYRFHQPNSKRDLFLKYCLLFLFARPFIVLRCSLNVSSLIRRALLLLLKADPSLWQFYRQSFIQPLSASDIPLSLLVPAWLRLFSFICTEASSVDLNNSWPLVFTRDHCMSLVSNVCQFLFNDQNAKQMSLQPSSQIPLHIPFSERFQETVQLYALDLQLNMIKQCALPLTSFWWTSDRMSLLDMLERIATRPLSTEDLPKVTTRSIQIVSELLRLSTYTAQYAIFHHFLNPSKPHPHHGWRGHVITLCKDSLHNTLLDHSRLGVNSLFVQQKTQGEERPQLFTEPSNFCSLCELVFVPISSSEDSLLDQSSWILAALNMALYIFIRAHGEQVAPEGQTILANLVSSLLPQPPEQSTFLIKFLDSLETRLHSDISVCDAHICSIESSLENQCNCTKESNRLRSLLTTQNSILLRLRLLDVTAKRLRHAMNDVYRSGIN